jgi:toxin ParE1/3/4
MARLIRSPLAKQDIKEVLTYTKEHWGNAQARQYGQLVENAHTVIAHNPQCGKPSDLVPNIFSYPIRRPGKPARHLLFYRITPTGTVEILRLLHEAMDFDQHLALSIHLAHL